MIKKLLPLLIFLVLSNLKLGAVSPVGGEVYYRHLKNLEYEVTIKAYRDCAGTAMGMIDLTITNDSFSLTTKTTRVKIEDVSNYCSTKYCFPSNTTVSSGLEAHYYMDTIDFGSGNFKKFISKNYCTVNFAMSYCCRNGAINTIAPMNMYIDAMLNLCYAQQSPIKSPQFINTPSRNIICNQTYSVSYAADSYLAGDSVGYELVNVQNGYKSPETYKSFYSGSLPITPYCVPPGSNTCVPTIMNLPTRGTSFNSKNGNFIITPSNCSEIPVIVVQVNLYRKINGVYQLIGYTKRDFSHILKISTINKPSLTTYRDYLIKARENTCIDIRIKDDTTNKNKDTVRLVVKKTPQYGQLSLLDSNAREKTLHYCWNVTDADYLNGLEDNIMIYAYDKACVSGQFMSTTINFKAAAPDSLTNIIVKTFYDINKNGKREPSEPYRPAQVLLNRFGTLSTITTDINGSFSQKPLKGNFSIGLSRNQFTYSTTKDSLFLGQFDSTYVISIGFNYTQGIKGRVFEDLNNNCIYDGSDILLRGIKIGDKTKNAVAFTDIKGEFLFNNKIGNYTLELDPNLTYTPTCIKSLSVQIQKDSQFGIYNFPLKKKANFKDLKISITPSNHVRNDASFKQIIQIENLGQTTISNFYISFLASKKLQQFSSTSPNTTRNDTVFWLIDSVTKGNSKTIDLIHNITKSNYSFGEIVNYQVWANVSDSVSDNNYAFLNEFINDTQCCDDAEKRSYAPKRYYPTHPTITYRLNYNAKKLSNRVLVTDTIDDNRFDLNTLQLLGSSTNHTAYVNQNILYLDFYSSTLINNVKYTYSIELKKQFIDTFKVLNIALAQFDNNAPLLSNTVSNTIISPIEYDVINLGEICENETIPLNFHTNYTPEKGNRFKVYLSDSLGQFSQPSLLLDSMTSSRINAWQIKTPNVYLSHSYQIKVLGSHPATEAFAAVTLPSIVINPTPPIQYSTNMKTGKICYGDTLTITASGASEYWFYNFNQPGGTYSSVNTFKKRLFSTGTFEINFKSNKGCLNTSPVIFTGINPLPIVELSALKYQLCPNENLELNYKGAVLYDIFLNGKTRIAKDISNSPLVRVPLPNKNYYTAFGTDNNGCKDSSNRIAITTYSLPSKPVITRVQKALKSNYTYGNQWFINGTKIDSATKQYFYPPFDAKYSVKFTDTTTCENISDEYNVNYTKLLSINNSLHFKVYPNPANQYLYIEPINASNFQYQFFDSYGKLILSNDAILKTSIDISDLSSGNYTLSIIQNNIALHFKVNIIK